METLIVKMKMGAQSKNAIMTSGWAAAVEVLEIKEGQIVLFDFYYDQNDRQLLLHLFRLGKADFLFFESESDFLGR